ncbi:MAG: SGNH/GDSL hydrolase family protein [Anaerolineae bacterium]
MKNILCYGDSNTWGCPPLEGWPITNVQRYGPDVRWGSVMRTTLGDGYWVVEEGLNGRTSVWDDPVEGEFRKGKTYLLPCLLSHAPLDLVILMLGTNDLKHRNGLSAWDIASGAGALIDVIQSSASGPSDSAPRVLLLCPPPIGKLTIFAEMFTGSEATSRQLAPHYQQVARDKGCEFLDVGQVIRSSDRDGIHFEAADQQKLGRTVAERVKQILG